MRKSCGKQQREREREREETHGERERPSLPSLPSPSTLGPQIDTLGPWHKHLTGWLLGNPKISACKTKFPPVYKKASNKLRDAKVTEHLLKVQVYYNSYNSYNSLTSRHVLEAI